MKIDAIQQPASKSVPGPAPREISEAKAPKKIDFKEVLANSNEAVKAKKLSQGDKDLSKSKNFDDFLGKLSNQRPELKKPKNKMGKEDFLKLFVAQLQNQDPLKPKDGGQIAAHGFFQVIRFGFMRQKRLSSSLWYRDLCLREDSNCNPEPNFSLRDFKLLSRSYEGPFHFSPHTKQLFSRLQLLRDGICSYSQLRVKLVLGVL